MMSTATAIDMQKNYDLLRPLHDVGGRRRTHVYTAQDGSSLVIYRITDSLAHALETLWYGKRVADENYHVGTGAVQ